MPDPAASVDMASEWMATFERLAQRYGPRAASGSMMGAAIGLARGGGVTEATVLETVRVLYAEPVPERPS